MPTLKDVLNYANGAGRLVVETDGDSTAARNGRGHAAAVVAAMAGIVPVAGVLMPINHSDGNSERHGYAWARRKDNQSVAYGARGPADLFTPGYPTTFKQYGPNVPVDGAWQGPQVGYFGSSTIADGGDGITAAQTTIGIADATGLQTSGTAKIVSTGEVISYTGISSNTLTGVTRGRNIAGAIAAEGATIVFGSNGPNIGALIYNDLVPVGAAGTVSAWVMSASAGSIPGSTVRLALCTQANVEAATASTTLVVGTTDQNVTGIAVGTVTRYDQAFTSADRGANSLLAGVTNANWNGPWGPAIYLYTGVTFTNRPFGVVPAMGISQGGLPLNRKISDLRRWHAGTSTIEYDLGLKTRYGVYRDLRSAGIGGNNRAGLMHVSIYGHNEAGSIIHNGLVDPAYAWTVRGQTTLSADIGAGDTSLTLTDAAVAAMLSTAGGSILITDGTNSERITFSTRSGNTLNTLTRGVFGTSARAWTAAACTVYVGYPVCHPIGIATDVLFDYNIVRNAWIAAGGTDSDFFYVYARPIPPSGTTADIDLFAATTNDPQKEARLRLMYNEIHARLSILPGFVCVDLAEALTGTEVTSYAWGQWNSDNVHNATPAYTVAWSRAVGKAQYGSPSSLRGR